MVCAFKSIGFSLLTTVSVGRDNEFDVVLIDTAGRMQDNEPLMRALAKVYIFCKCNSLKRLTLVQHSLYQ